MAKKKKKTGDTAQANSIQFTVGRIDAGIAILLSPSHHVVEFPTEALPGPPF
jgi:hypothetical protein